MSTGIEAATSRAVNFLERRQLPSGEIEVVTVPNPAMVGESSYDPSIFPAGLVVLALAHVPGAERIRSRAADFLMDQMDPEGVWRHWTKTHPARPSMPPDVDDTSIVTAALREEGRAAPDPTGLLRANRNRHGLYYTWFAPRLAWAGRVHARAAWTSWLQHPTAMTLFFNTMSAARCDIDAVVNANALSLLPPTTEDAPVVELLLGVLRDGTETTCDKWYENPFVVWYSFARALAPRHPEALELIAAKLAAARPTTSMDLALARTTAVVCGVRPKPSSIDVLLGEQREDGSWERAAVYHGGRPRRRDGTFGPRHPSTPHWGSEEITTALCLEALWVCG